MSPAITALIYVAGTLAGAVVTAGVLRRFMCQARHEQVEAPCRRDAALQYTVKRMEENGNQ